MVIVALGVLSGKSMPPERFAMTEVVKTIYTMTRHVSLPFLLVRIEENLAMISGKSLAIEMMLLVFDTASKSVQTN